MSARQSGILLHIASLPSPYGIGDLGAGAYQFADFLHKTRQRLWQILPLGLTLPTYAHSPFHAPSAFAFNWLLISPEQMIRDGMADPADLPSLPDFPRDRVDYPTVTAFKEEFLERVYRRFQTRGPDSEFEEFCARSACWLDDFALFSAVKTRFQNRTWSEWPLEIRDRHPEALKTLSRELSEAIEKEKFLQFVFCRQWFALKNYCNERGIRLFGDMPIYVSYDSSDLWAFPEIFKLDQDKRPYVVAGVPPDYFSQTGQLWGNPIYNWDALKAMEYDWWIRRIEHNLNCFDWVRIDHFRGLVAYWEIPSGEESAINGAWESAPAVDFFAAVLKKNPGASIVAEDLGYITPDVREVMDRFNFTGMKLLVFGLEGDLPANPYAPHRHIQNCVLYTGNHDCNTVRGWFENNLSPEGKEQLFRYLGRKLSAQEISWELVRLAMMSVADTAILPAQDILGLGEEARMNRPATTTGNWQWRLLPECLDPDLAQRLLGITELYGRA